MSYFIINSYCNKNNNTNKEYYYNEFDDLKNYMDSFIETENKCDNTNKEITEIMNQLKLRLFSNRAYFQQRFHKHQSHFHDLQQMDLTLDRYICSVILHFLDFIFHFSST